MAKANVSDEVQYRYIRVGSFASGYVLVRVPVVAKD